MSSVLTTKRKRSWQLPDMRPVASTMAGAGASLVKCWRGRCRLVRRCLSHRPWRLMCGSRRCIPSGPQRCGCLLLATGRCLQVCAASTVVMPSCHTGPQHVTCTYAANAHLRRMLLHTTLSCYDVIGCPAHSRQSPDIQYARPGGVFTMRRRCPCSTGSIGSSRACTRRLHSVGGRLRIPRPAAPQ